MDAVTNPGETLGWGHEYVMVAPDHYRLDYSINPYMDLADQPDAVLARHQWDALVATLRDLGATVHVIDQRPDAPDMVYAMNLGLAWRDPAAAAPHVTLSHMRYAERRMETETARAWFQAAGWTTSTLGADGVGPHFEAGDAFAFGGSLVVGHGPRTEELALKHLATELRVRTLGLRITHPGMYHLDLAFCPLSATAAIVCPDAFDAPSARAALDLVPDPLVIDEEEALTFCANSVVVGRTVVMPACPSRVHAWLSSRGFEVVVLDLSEFHKGGGSVRCLTNPVDVTLGRDLPQPEVGEVVLPEPAAA